jgi:hypothetical protein
VLNQGDGTVQRIDPATGEVVATIVRLGRRRGKARPQAVAGIWMYRHNRVDLATVLKARVVKQANAVVIAGEVEHRSTGRVFQRELELA